MASKNLFSVVFGVALLLSTTAYSGTFIYRYKDDTSLDGNTTPPEPTPFSCPEPLDDFSASNVSELVDSCLYEAPKVTISTSELAPAYTAEDVNQWCSDVTGWEAENATETIQNGNAARFSNSWSQTPSVRMANAIICSPDGGFKVAPIPRAGTLKNADFECLSGFEHCNWPGFSSTGNHPERWIGKSKYLMPYSQWTGSFAQDVAVDDSLLAKPFPVSVEWLQSSDVAGSQAKVDLHFLDSSKSKIGEVTSTLKAPPRATVWLDRALDGNAPAGTKFIRVIANLAGPKAAVDNISLVIDGLPVSEINGAFGTPKRPRDLLLNAGAQESLTYWKELATYYNANISNSVTSAVDSFDITSPSYFTNLTFRNHSMYQQVWIPEEVEGEPFTLEWLQASEGEGSSDRSLVQVDFFTKDGDLIQSFDRGTTPMPNRWMVRRAIEGQIPSNSGFAIVQWNFQSKRAYLDKMNFKIGGKPYSAQTGKSPQTLDLCPSYINTLNAPNSSDYWADGGVKRFDHIGHIEWSTFANLNPVIYKHQCVGPNARYLVADYDLLTAKAWGGIAFRAFDKDGNQIGQEQKNLFMGPEPYVFNSSKRVKVWDVFKLPANTAFVQTQWTGSNHQGGGTVWANANKLSLIMNGDLPTPPIEFSKLRNTRGDASTDHWSAIQGGGQAPNVVKNASALVISESTKVVGGSSSSSSASMTIECEGSCTTRTENLFNTIIEGGSVFQDVFISRYNLTPNNTVTLEWTQTSPIQGLSVTSGNGGKSTVTLNMDGTSAWANHEGGMALEFYDINGQKLGQSVSPMRRAEPLYMGGSRYDLNASLPANTWKIRVIYTTATANGAAFDDINLRAGSVNLTE